MHEINMSLKKDKIYLFYTRFCLLNTFQSFLVPLIINLRLVFSPKYSSFNVICYTHLCMVFFAFGEQDEDVFEYTVE